MTNRKKSFVFVFAVAAALPITAWAGIGDLFDNDVKKGEGGVDTNVAQTCSERYGTIALNEPEHYYYRQVDLPDPKLLLKPMIQNSQCFGLVNRGSAVKTMKAERQFADDGELQKNSRMGGGQIKAADYSLVADVALSDGNTGGSAAGGLIGGMFGGGGGRTFGALLGGLGNKGKEAQVVLELVDLRTSESYVVQGAATKKDLKGGIAGIIGPVAGGFGGYEDTDESKMVAYAFANAYENLVDQLGGYGLQGASADHADYMVSATVKMRGGPTTKAPELGILYEGTSIIKTGVENGEWVEIEALGKTGWIMSSYITR